MPVAEYILPAISLIVGLNARAIGMRLGVIDYPLRGHKTHQEPTPLVGGIAVALPLLTYCTLFWWTHPESLGHAVLDFAIGGAFLLGFIDDRISLPSLLRLFLTVVLALVVIVTIPDFIVEYFDFTFLTQPILLAPFSVAFSVLVVVGMVNATNMTDGINGLACGLCLIWSLFLLFYAPSEFLEIVVLLALCLFVTLLFNLRGKLFLGDSGSYTVGFTISLVTIYTYNASSGALHADAVVAWFIVPVVDCLRLMAVRASKRRSPMLADNDHLHHRLQRIMPVSGTLITYWMLVAIPGAVAMVFPAITLYAVLTVVFVYAGLLLVTARPLNARKGKEAVVTQT
jgi:UDP-GlcNAc:undecaprenyl-phosphate GlcNAc-1-phosphate transferase